jgi:hypothetical protein
VQLAGYSITRFLSAGSISGYSRPKSSSVSAIELVKRIRRKWVGGAGEIEPLDAVECEKTDVPLLHGLHYRLLVSWQQ